VYALTHIPATPKISDTERFLAMDGGSDVSPGCNERWQHR